VDLRERAYGGQCRLWLPGRGINWPVIRATVFDEFVVAHTLGWWCKVGGPRGAAGQPAEAALLAPAVQALAAAALCWGVRRWQGVHAGRRRAFRTGACARAGRRAHGRLRRRP